MFLLSSYLVNIPRTICIFNRAHLPSFPLSPRALFLTQDPPALDSFPDCPVFPPFHALIYRYIFGKAGKTGKMIFMPHLCAISRFACNLFQTASFIFSDFHISSPKSVKGGMYMEVIISLRI